MTIERAKQLAKQWANGYVCSLREGEAEEYHKMCLSALRAQQENPFGGWISVKDKLPEDDQEVILCTRETETYGKHREKKKIYKNIYIGYFDGYEWLTSYCHGCEYIFRMNEKYPNETIEVTHWMPLPDPLPDPPQEV